MNYHRLGNTALRVSELCLGTMTFGSRFYNIGDVDQSLANEMVQFALDRGINFFDTADVYSFGESERILGRALEAADVDRRDVVVATKVGSPMTEEGRMGEYDGFNINRGGLSRHHIMHACERSLERLGVDYIDLYQVHRWDPDTPIEETLRALTDLVRRDRVRYIGCSNWSVRHLRRALTISENTGLERFVSLQPYYSLVGRDLEYELLPLCREEGLGVLPWSPLAGGFLTGKYRREGAEETGRRSEFEFPPVDTDMGYEAVEALDEMAERKGATIPQLALAWLRHRSGVTSIIVGARTMDQLEENVGCVDVDFEEEELERLDEITRPARIYPQWMIRFTSRSLPSGS